MEAKLNCGPHPLLEGVRFIVNVWLMKVLTKSKERQGSANQDTLCLCITLDSVGQHQRAQVNIEPQECQYWNIEVGKFSKRNIKETMENGVYRQLNKPFSMLGQQSEKFALTPHQFWLPWIAVQYIDHTNKMCRSSVPLQFPGWYKYSDITKCCHVILELI